MGISRTQVVKFIRKGDTGDKGEQGATLRGPQAWSDCAVGYAFKAGKVGEEWKDVVLYNGNYYSCKKSHSKTTSNYPGSTTDRNNGYWQLGDKIELVATKILLATYALIENLGVKYVEINSTDGYIKQTDENGNIIFLLEKGKITCNKGTFDNIDVTSGHIAGFQISGKDLTNDPFANDASIIFRNDRYGAFAGIGGNILPGASGARGIARFENHDTTDVWKLGTNYAMLVSAQGTLDNRAIQIDGGAVSGFALKNTVISSSGTKTLSRYDYNVLAINDSDLTLVLPTMQLYDDGHVIRIKRLGNGALKLKMGYCYTYNGTSSRYSMPALIYDQNQTLSGSSTLNLDSVCDAMELVWCRDIIRTVGSTKYYGVWIQYKLPRDW